MLHEGKSAGIRSLTDNPEQGESGSTSERYFRNHGSFGKIVLPALSLAIAAFFGLWSLANIFRYGVSILFWDEWDFVTVVRKLSTGEISWLQALLSRNEEHQLTAQIAISAAGWYLSHMHLQAVLVWNWTISVLFCLLAATITAREKRRASGIVWFTLAVSFFFVFNPAAYQVMLWALPPVYSLLSLAFLIGVYLAQSKFLQEFKIVGMALLSLFASFVLGNGLLFWIALPAVLFRYEELEQLRRNKISLLIYTALLVLTIAFYVIGSANYVRHTPPTAAGLTVADIGLFFLAFTGNFVSLAISPQPVELAQVLGAVIVLLFATAAATSLSLVKSREQRRFTLIWFYFGLFWLVSGLFVAFGRYSFGLAYALDASRYVMASSFFLVAALVLAANSVVDLTAILPRNVKLYSSLVSVVAVLLCIGIYCRSQQSRTAVKLMLHSHFVRLQGVVAADSAEMIDLPARNNIFPHPSFTDFEADTRFLNAQGWLHPSQWDQQFLRHLQSLTPNSSCGTLDSATRVMNSVRLEGWGYLPTRSQRAHAIIIAGFEAGKLPKVLGVVFTSKQRPDVAANLRTGEALSTGWTFDLPLTDLDKHGYVVASFTYDAETGQVCETAGARPLP